MISIYNYSDYKKYIKAYIESAVPRYGVMKKMAVAANCHPSYLTQALSSKVHITMDHAMGIAEFVNLSDAERDYFFLLVEHSRSARPGLRLVYEKKLKDLKASQEKISERLQRKSMMDLEALSMYYSSWLFSAIHILTSVPEFQTAEKLSEKLNIKKNQCEKYLKQLEKMKLVNHKQGFWQHSGHQLHVPDDSHLVHLHHNNWRQQAVLDSQLQNTQSVHFTGVYSITKSDFDILKGIILKAIEGLNKTSLSSGTEEGVMTGRKFLYHYQC